jgi:hypothetical protein
MRVTSQVLAGLLLTAAAATAEPICIEFKGSVQFVRDDSGVLEGRVQPGDPIGATYIYESTTPDANELPTVGDYWHTSGPAGIEIVAGGLKARTRPNNVSFLVELVNDHLGRDNYLIRSYNNESLMCNAPVEYISWQLDDPTMTALSSTRLEKSPPRLDDWQEYGLMIDGILGSPGYSFTIRGHVESAIRCGGAASPTAVVAMPWQTLKSLYR